MKLLTKAEIDELLPYPGVITGVEAQNLARTALVYLLALEIANQEALMYHDGLVADDDAGPPESDIPRWLAEAEAEIEKEEASGKPKV